MLWTGRSCRRRQCWLWRKRKRATGPASAPKLRQNRIKCSKRPQSTIQVQGDSNLWNFQVTKNGGATQSFRGAGPWATATADEIIEHVRGQIARYKVPDY